MNEEKKKLGKPTTNHRNKRFEIRLNEDENKMLQECSEKLKKTRTDILIMGLEEVYKKIK